MLRIRQGEPRQRDPPDIRYAIAVAVFEVEHVGGIGNQYARLPAHNAGRQRKPLGEYDARIGIPVAIRIHEPDHAPRASRIKRIARHFHDIQPPRLVHRHVHRIGEKRLCGKRFYAKTLGYFERGERGGGFVRRPFPQSARRAVPYMRKNGKRDRGRREPYAPERPPPPRPNVSEHLLSALRYYLIKSAKRSVPYNSQPARYGRCRYCSASGALGMVMVSASYRMSAFACKATTPSNITSVSGTA